MMRQRVGQPALFLDGRGRVRDPPLHALRRVWVWRRSSGIGARAEEVIFLSAMVLLGMLSF